MEKKVTLSLLDELFDGVLKPLHSKNARTIFEIFIQNKNYKHITTYDIELVLKRQGVLISKKEINSWLITLQEHSLIKKLEERGKPVISSYNDRYTFDLWRLTELGILICQRIPYLLAEKEIINIPRLSDLTPTLINEIEKLYFTSKIIITLYNRGNNLNEVELKKLLFSEQEKLIVHFLQPNNIHLGKPYLNIKLNPQNFKEKILIKFGWTQKKDFKFNLTGDGQNLARDITVL
jgi:hypothetical protein